MQISVETTSNVERRITVGVPKERIEPEIQNRLKSLARKAKINGFRPGKVPLKVVEQKYGLQVRQEVIGEIVQTSFYEAVEQENLRPAGEPSFDFNTDIRNLEQGLSYTATFEIYPEISSIEVDNLVVEKWVAQVTEEDIDTMVYRLRQQRQTWHEVERPATEGDRVVIDFTGTIQGEPFEGNEAKQIPLILGQKTPILPGLEDQLVGVVGGEDREVDLHFPANYINPKLADQTVHLAIHVDTVSEPQLPEIDEDFIKSLGVADGQLETLRQDARHNMERELEYAIKNRTKQQLLHALLKANPIDVPSSLVEEEAQRLLESRQKEGHGQALNVELFKKEALTRVQLGLLVGELVKTHQIQVPPEKVKQLIERIAVAYENPEAVVKGYYSDKRRLKEVESMVLEDEVVEWLLNKAQITEKQSNFYEVMEQQHIVPQE